MSVLSAVDPLSSPTLLNAACTPACAGWQPVVGREGRPMGFRIALHGAPGRPLAEAFGEVLDGFTAEGASGMPHGLVLIAPPEQPLDESLAHWGAPRNVLIEIDQRALADAAQRAVVLQAQRQGLRLALRIADELPPVEALAPFQYLLASGLRQRPAREIATLALGPRSAAEVEAAFAAGASGVVGWPLGAPAGQAGLHPQQRALLDLIRLVQADAGVSEVEAGFKREPVLAYMLLTLANSPAFLRTQPIASLPHAIQLLGYQRLVKWLVLLLVIASKNSRALPAIYMAVVRGLLLENCAAAAGEAATVRDECFVVGAFSLLDRITGRPLTQLTADLVLPDAVRAAILNGGGRYGAYLALALALEGGDCAAMARGADVLGLTPAAVNAALYRALATNDALQSLV